MRERKKKKKKAEKKEENLKTACFAITGALTVVVTSGTKYSR